jgi:hypothetical protein
MPPDASPDFFGSPQTAVIKTLIALQKNGHISGKTCVTFVSLAPFACRVEQ